MTLKEFNEKYGRLVLIVAVVIIWALILWSMWTNGYVETWSLWKIPTVMPPFVDFRLIPSGAETYRLGLDLTIPNPTDPAEHIFNYPKIWYLFFYTGISQDDTIWISVLLIILFFITVFAFPRKINVLDALIILPVIFSPAAMLLYERGNVDLAFFILCGLVIILAERHFAWAVGILSVAAIFKLFPFFGVGAFLHENKSRFFKVFTAISIMFFVYVLISFDSMTAAWKLTQRGTYLSYGNFVIFSIVEPQLNSYLIKVLSSDQILVFMKVAPYFLSLSLMFVMFTLGVKTKASYEPDSERELIAFRMGASIYIGTFFLGNNWDYRLAFLTFTIPQISHWIFSHDFKQKWLVIGIFISLLISCWYSIYFSDAYGGPYEIQLELFDEAMNWILFGGLTYLLVASAPRWFRTFSWNPFSQKQIL